MGEGSTGTMATLLEAATQLFTWSMTNLATVVSTVLSNPLLLMGFLLGIVGFVIGLTKRLMNIR